MGPNNNTVKEALKYVRDIENNIPKHFWPGLIQAGWLVLESDGTPNWNYEVTSHVTNSDLVLLYRKSHAWNYFHEVTLHKPLPRNYRSPNVEANAVP